MLSNWHSELYARQRQQVLGYEADQHRLAQTMRKTRRGRIVRVYGPVLYSIGSLMTTWGQRLKTEYSDPAPFRFDNAESQGR